MYLYRLCKKVECGLDKNTRRAMWTNIGLDAAVGLVPIIGDIGDAFFRCNTKNVRLLGDYLDKVYMPDELKKRKKAGERWWMVLSGRNGKDEGAGINKKKRENRQDEFPYSPATVYEEFSDDESPGLPYTEPSRRRREHSQTRPGRR